MHVVVTGAAGFVGSHACERLLAGGAQVLGIDSFTPFYPRALKEANLDGLRGAPGFRLAERDLLDSGLERELAGADVVCHLAGRPGVRSASVEGFFRDNVWASEAVIKASAAAGVRRVVLASSSSVYGPVRGPVREDAPLRPISPYGRSKHRAELVARSAAERYGIELVVLRLFTVYGPRQRPDMAFARFVAAALDDGRMPLLGGGCQVRDFTYVSDAVDAMALATERGRPGRAYNASGGCPARLGDALALLGAALPRQPELIPAPPDPREPDLTGADLSAARADLGYEPAVDLERGLRMQAAEALCRSRSRRELALAPPGSAPPEGEVALEELLHPSHFVAVEREQPPA
jgi:nucleoside-diphosphate-sugar epimerase